MNNLFLANILMVYCSIQVFCYLFVMCELFKVENGIENITYKVNYIYLEFLFAEFRSFISVISVFCVRMF